jgi:hypothetical protein
MQKKCFQGDKFWEQNSCFYRTIGFKTGLRGFVLGDSKLELAFLLVSWLLDNVFMNKKIKIKI